MNKWIIGAVIAIVVIAGGSYLAFHKTSKTSPSSSSTASSSAPSTTSNSSTSGSSTNSSSNSAPESSGQSASFTINANDASADKETVNVSQGQKVSITFKVDEQGTYHGGLEFISTDPAIDSGPIATSSSKTVTFTATKSFSFQPYWYASQIKKDYLISVNVT